MSVAEDIAGAVAYHHWHDRNNQHQVEGAARFLLGKGLSESDTERVLRVVYEAALSERDMEHIETAGFIGED